MKTSNQKNSETSGAKSTAKKADSKGTAQSKK